jgi:lipopolysaccharide biosynthesis glycosyltransferase
MNLKFWRHYNVPERAIEFIRNNPEKVQYWDQDALNAILIGQWIELPAYWNAQHPQEWLDRKRNPTIIHFTGYKKPWHWSCDNPFKHEYYKYRLKTPWPKLKLEGRPRFLRRIARLALPSSLRQWLLSNIITKI